MRNKCLWFTLLIFTVSFGLNATAFGKPQDEKQLAKLQQQIDQLQAQLKSATGKQKKSETKQESNERVRDLGQQIIRRAPRDRYEQDVPLQIRLYDLSDLFAVSPNYPAINLNEFQAANQFFPAAPAGMRGMTAGGGQGGFGGGGGQSGGGGGFGAGGVGGGGGVFSIPATQFAAGLQEGGNLNMQAAQVTLKQLVNTMRATVKPEMWGDDSTSARIEFLGNTLLITASEEMHTQINDLLNLFREHWGKRRTVSVQTWWIRADSGVTSDLVDSETSKKVGAGVVAENRWKEFFNKAKEEKKIAYASTLTGHNNQTLHAISGKQISLTVGAEPFETNDIQWHVKDFDDLESVIPELAQNDDYGPENFGFLGQQKRIVGFRPVKSFFHNGAVLQITPLATRGGNYVILDMQAKLNELARGDRGETISVEKEGGETSIQLDDIDYLSCQFSSTLRCPKNQVVLAGSMTSNPSAENETPEILIFVRVSVHTIEEDESDWKKSTVVMPAAAKTKSKAGAK